MKAHLQLLFDNATKKKIKYQLTEPLVVNLLQNNS